MLNTVPECTPSAECTAHARHGVTRIQIIKPDLIWQRSAWGGECWCSAVEEGLIRVEGGQFADG